MIIYDWPRKNRVVQWKFARNLHDWLSKQGSLWLLEMRAIETPPCVGATSRS
jgi:hypothetical protein